MRPLKIKFLLSLSVVLALGIGSCDNQWDDAVKVESATLAGTVMDAIESKPDLSSFTGMLKETGYDVVLASDNNYTVLAPSNQALAAYADASAEEKKKLVRNHIAPMTYNAKALSALENLMMINGKNQLLSGIELSSEEVLCNNGVLRIAANVVMPMESIFEYLKNNSADYKMARAILAFGDSVMDMDKSIQKGVDAATGAPVYDTVFMYVNRFLDKIAIENEDSLYTLLLLDDGNFDLLKTKYAKYTAQYNIQTGKINEAKTDSVAIEELVGDLAFRPGNDEGSLFTSVTGIDVDMSSSLTIKDVNVSNGRVLIANGVQIRMKDNKIKDIYIQGEDYLETLDETYTYVRLRDYAMGGKDVMVGGRSVARRDTVIFNEETGKNEAAKTGQYTYMYKTEYSTRYTKDINFYLKYAAKLYSTKYNLYWVAYDDISEHSSGDADWDTLYDPEQPNKPCPSIYRVQQKLYISLPGYPALRRTSGVIENMAVTNNAVAMSGIDPEQLNERVPNVGVNAGVWQEQPLRWFRASGSYNALTTSLTAAATKDVLNCTSMGNATFFVTNSPYVSDSKSTDNGMIFLDYIRLVPVFDEDE